MHLIKNENTYRRIMLRNRNSMSFLKLLNEAFEKKYGKAYI
jgi:hypothetical protein